MTSNSALATSPECVITLEDISVQIAKLACPSNKDDVNNAMKAIEDIVKAKTNDMDCDAILNTDIKNFGQFILRYRYAIERLIRENCPTDMAQSQEKLDVFIRDRIENLKNSLRGNDVIAECRAKAEHDCVKASIPKKSLKTKSKPRL